MAVVAEILLSNAVRENRLSAEYFDPCYSFKPTEKYKWQKIGQVLTQCQYGLSVAMNESGRGIQMYRMNEIVDCLVEEAHKYAPVSAAEFEAFRLNKDDVLFNRTNSIDFVGRTGILKDDVSAVFASYLIRVRTDGKKILPEFLAIYLNTPFGIGQVRRRAMPSINQANVSAFELRRIPIPLVDVDQQRPIAELVTKSHSRRADAKRLYSEAEQILVSAMGLKGFKPAQNTSTEAMLSQLIATGRSDAEQFQQACTDVLTQLSELGSTARLRDLLYFNKRGSQPIYRSKGLKVVNSKHVRKNYVILSVNRTAEPSQEGITIVTNDLLVNGTGVGTIGRAAVYLSDTPALPDNHITVLRTHKIDPAYLSVYLNSIAGQLQVTRHQRGSSGQIELYPFDLGKFIIWKGTDQLQGVIGDKVRSAFDASNDAKALMNKAKRMVNALLSDAVSS